MDDNNPFNLSSSTPQGTKIVGSSTHLPEDKYMNSNTQTWKERAKEYLLKRDDYIVDVNYLKKIKESLELVNTNGLSREDEELFRKVFYS